MFWKQSSTIRGETNDNDHDLLMGAFTEKGRIQEYIFAPGAKWYSWFTCHVNGTRHSYELQRSDGGPKYEIWLRVMKSYVELHLRLLESYQVRRLLDIHNNFRVMRNKCEHQRDVKIGLSQRLFLTNSMGWLQCVAMLESKGYSLRLIQDCYQYRDFLKSCIWRSVVIGTTRRFWKNIWILVSRKLNSHFDGWSKDFGLNQNIEETCICMKLSGSWIVSWNLICRRHILSGSYGSIILDLYVNDIFE